MSIPNFSQGQKVLVTQDHNHIIAGTTEYTIGSLDRISGDYSALLLKDGKCVGATPLGKLEAVK